MATNAYFGLVSFSLFDIENDRKQLYKHLDIFFNFLYRNVMWL